MNIAYIDCFHGAAGDMLLAGLIDAGLPLERLQEVLAGLAPGLSPDTYRIQSDIVISHHVRGRQLRVETTEAQPARSWSAIRQLLLESTLPARIRTHALAVFERLARAEAAVHGVAVDHVHFHEVGAVDSIIDMVGCCAALELLEIERLYASPLPVGRGWVNTQHGPLPVPAPATLAVLADVGAPLLPAPSAGELVTPTAAALLAELADFDQPAMRVQQVGYGLGQKTFARLNGLRVWVGTALEDDSPDAHTHAEHHHMHTHAEHHHAHAQQENQTAQPVATSETVVELRCNLDDVTGEVIAYVIEQLLQAGALDAWAAPLVMKKGRPGLQLACLAQPAHVEPLAQLMLRETPTFGVRWSPMQRLALQRASVTVQTPWGAVRLKQKLIDGEVVANAPEYDDCAALAQMHHVPLMQVYTAALQMIGSNATYQR
ncbi:MAG: nickel pincer cofactor biosynthesis protein LarC [Chloroflexaceae bacterium]|nr:nickel pincer cofactor biosynthesis protein LarC [Chloroflexaceae bacterium]